MLLFWFDKPRLEHFFISNLLLCTSTGSVWQSIFSNCIKYYWGIFVDYFELVCVPSTALGMTRRVKIVRVVWVVVLLALPFSPKSWWYFQIVYLLFVVHLLYLVAGEVCRFVFREHRHFRYWHNGAHRQSIASSQNHLLIDCF